MIIKNTKQMLPDFWKARRPIQANSYKNNVSLLTKQSKSTTANPAEIGNL